MALYSWFLRTKTDKNRKTVQINNTLAKASESVKYIENYTMWPTATIKPNIKVNLPNFSRLDNKPTEQQAVLSSSKVVLTPIKS